MYVIAEPIWMHSFEYQIVPSSAKLTIEDLETYQITHQFYEEAQYRHDFEAYCQWYYATAEQHQKEAESMKNDLNIFGWFCR